MSGPLEVARDLLPGVVVETDAGAWHVHETPGHAPSHVVLHQPESRLLISGDHVLGRISLYFDHGWTPDPVQEFLDSLDVVERLDARLTLSGHGRPFTDLRRPRRRATARWCGSGSTPCSARCGERGEATAFDLLPGVYGDKLMPETAGVAADEDALLPRAPARRRGARGRSGAEPVRWSAA